MTSGSGSSPGWQRHDLHTPDDVQRSLCQVLHELRRLGYSDREQFGIRLSLEEALVNAIRHGHRGDTSKTVAFRYQLDGQAFVAEVEDEGPGFRPDAVPDPLAPENLEMPGGRGVFLMRRYMTDVRYNDRGNCVTLYKERGQGPDGCCPSPNGNGKHPS